MENAERCKRYRRRILEISQRVSAMHVAGAFSCLEIVDSIYQKMNEGDTFIMSKGHGAMAQYVILEDQGKVNLNDYCRGPIGCHPDLGVPGIAAATGSLGHGLGMALGIAYADPKHKVYCLISDGELQEGSTWESLSLAPILKTTNLLVFVDFNGVNSSAPIGFPIEFAKERLMSFGWEVATPDGHRDLDIKAAMTAYELDIPRAIVCKTKKGWPISYMMEDPIWHYKSPSPEQYQQALEELA